MLVKKISDVESKPVAMEGSAGVKMRLLLAEEDGAPNFRMRLFEVEKGGCSPYHSHNYEHEVLILEGKGELLGEGKQFPLQPGDVVLVSSEEEHQFRNVGEQIFKFICLIPTKKS